MQSPKTQPRESSISVAVRVRPFTESENQHLIRQESENAFLINGPVVATRTFRQPRGLRKILNVVDDRMLLFDQDKTNLLNNMANYAMSNGRVGRIREHRFIFDRLFDEDASQHTVYEATTKPLLDSVLDGFNATVFAYGATGCGKTYTISGTPESPGIIFSTMKDLIEKMEEKKDTHTVELSLSYLEIYNETIHDLLKTESEKKNLVIQEDQNKRITVSNLSVFKPQTVEEVMDLIMAGNANRTVSPTEANATSSRSHAVLQINVDTKPRSANLIEEHTFATLSIIDLAGSERASSTKNTGERLQEGANINKSLLALGNCINALCDPRRRNHVPYRDSKLTRLLKFSLGGNCKTVMIVCVSPSSMHYDETLNTLKYANRAKEIKTKVIRNQHNLSRHVGSYLKMITEQKQEIEELRNRENKVIEHHLMKLTLQREKNQKMMLESLDNLIKSIAKYSNVQMSKAYLLAKKKIVTILKMEVDNFLKSFDSIFNINDDTDLIEFESVVHGFSSLMSKAEALSTKFMIQIQELEKSYYQETELDHIINESSKSIAKKLSELENWTSFDQLNAEIHFDRVKDTVEKNILYQSSVFFDQSIKKVGSLKFSFDSLLSLFKNCLENDTVKLETLQKILNEILSTFDNLLNNDINLNILQNFQSTSLPPSPRKKGFKRSTSPIHKSPVKISKLKSPVRLKKKVRWDDEFESSLDIDSSDKDQSMDDTPLHEKLQKGMNISPSKPKLNPFLKSMKSNQSLTSRKLIPPTIDTKLAVNESLGAPQRLQTTTETDSLQKDISKDTEDNLFSSSINEGDNGKENTEPVSSVFGDISSIF